MKKYSIAVLLLFVSIITNAQDMYYETSTSDLGLEHTSKVELMNHSLSLIDCPLKEGLEISSCTRNKINQFLSENIEYPELAKTLVLEARCKILFEVSGSGNVIKSKISGCNEDIFGSSIESVLSKMSFRPAIQNGIPVSRIITTHVDYNLR